MDILKHIRNFLIPISCRKFNHILYDDDKILLDSKDVKIIVVFIDLLIYYSIFSFSSFFFFKLNTELMKNLFLIFPFVFSIIISYTIPAILINYFKKRKI